MNEMTGLPFYSDIEHMIWLEGDSAWDLNSFCHHQNKPLAGIQNHVNVSTQTDSNEVERLDFNLYSSLPIDYAIQDQVSDTVATAKKRSYEFDKSVNDIEENRAKMSRKEFIKYLFPSDIRMSYTRILVDAFNTGNYSLLQNALASFCAPKCRLKSYYYGPVGPSYGPRIRELKGINEISAFFNIHHKAIPDCVFSADDFEIKSYENIPKNFIERINFLNANLQSTFLDKPLPDKSACESYNGLVFFSRIVMTGRQLYDIITEKSDSKSNSSELRREYFGSSKVYLGEKYTTKLTTINVNMKGYSALVLNSKGKITRFEFHVANSSD